MKTPTIEFTRDYYENGKAAGLSCYENYRWLPDLTIPMAERLIEHLGIEQGDTILDFGCAKGFLVKALRGLGLSAYGVDVSEYAVSQAGDDVREFLAVGTVPPRASYDWIICKDVLEHLSEEEVGEALAAFRRCGSSVFIAVPLGNGGVYTIPEMEKDVTHRVRRPLWWWSNVVEAAGFKIQSATFTMRGIKENWTRKFPMGNGFIVAKPR